MAGAGEGTSPVYTEESLGATLTEKLQASHVAAVDLSDGCGSKVNRQQPGGRWKILGPDNDILRSFSV